MATKQPTHSNTVKFEPTIYETPKGIFAFRDGFSIRYPVATKGLRTLRIIITDVPPEVGMIQVSYARIDANGDAATLPTVTLAETKS